MVKAKATVKDLLLSQPIYFSTEEQYENESKEEWMLVAMFRLC